MFRGQFVHTIDAKGRVSLPSRFRDVLMAGGDGRYIVTPNPFDPCLHLYPLRGWEEYERKLSEVSTSSRALVLFRRLYVSAAQEGELDGAGRIRLPQDFRERVQLDKDVLFAGMGKIVEVWSKQLWDAELAKSTKEAPQILEEVRELIGI